MCAGGTFLKNTGSKSNTLIASSGLAMSGAFASSSGSFDGRSTPAGARPGEPSSGLADSHWSRRRRFSNRSRCDAMGIPPFERCELAPRLFGAILLPRCREVKWSRDPEENQLVAGQRYQVDGPLHENPAVTTAN